MRYLLSLGSNCPDKHRRLENAEVWLRANFSDVETSGIYTSRALNGLTPDYCNMVARISSDLSVTDLTAVAKDYERQCGRTPRSKLHGQIEMDVDIIAADRTILRPDEYTRPYFIHGLQLLPKSVF